jgi:glucose-1-phosphate cytidylyltransferase
VISGDGRDVQLLNDNHKDWRVTLIDTGIWRNIGERLWAARDLVKNDDMFLANYSDGLTDVDLDDMVRRFRASGKLACFLAVRPPLTYHLADIAEDGHVREFRSSQTSDIWINGGYFVFRPEIFDYMQEGEELVLEPFKRLIEADKLMAYKHEAFWRSMDTLRDWQVLEDMVEKGDMPWSRQMRERPGRKGLAVARS